MKTDRKPAVIEAFRRGGTWKEAAAITGLCTTTIWRWMQSDPEFAAALKEACFDADAEVEAVTFGNCIDPDPAHNTLRMFWLKCRKPNVYQDRQSIDHGGEFSVRHSYVEPGLPPSPHRAGADRPGDEEI